jgi:hypothetical protein
MEFLFITQQKVIDCAIVNQPKTINQPILEEVQLIVFIINKLK